MALGELFGYLAGLSLTFCFLPQTILTLKTKNTQGLSMLSYFIYAIGLICWIIYGIYLGSVPMMLFNSIALVFAISILYTIITQRGKNENKKN
ncbi:MAG: glutathione synthetase [Alphaproteobacteria bacterium]|nr:glutathione synthetase [Alphaproteobacteria bacterium]